MKGYKIRGKESEKIFYPKRLFRQSHTQSFSSSCLPESLDLLPVFVPVFKLELNPIVKCFVSTEMAES